MKIKATVKMPFCDKFTGRNYKAGEVIELTPKRFNEILTKGKLVELAENESPTTAKEIKE